MSVAYWCILVAALLPYGWIVIAKRNGERFNNRDPRPWLARQDNPLVQRANAAHLNAFEAFAPFAAGVLMAQAAGVPASLVQTLALAFVAFRILHGVLYITALHWLRSLVWLGGLVCVVWLMVAAAQRMG
ncbi:MAG: MAPEG family protein [Pseudomonadota bacterium]|nr:MAPEG family protein [Pseudomonadota bacterium]